MVEALPQESLRLVADLGKQEPADNSHTVLNCHLLSSHQQIDFQLVEMLSNKPVQGNRKPSHLTEAVSSDGSHVRGLPA